MKTVVLLVVGLLPLGALGQVRPTPAAHAQQVVEFQQKINHEFSDPAESPLTAAERAAF